MPIAVFNAGSSSLKFGLFSDDARDCHARGILDWNAGRLTFQAGKRAENRSWAAGGMAAAVGAIREIFFRSAPGKIRAVGQRVVHGGHRFPESSPVTAKTLRELAALHRLAPLHNPPATECIRAARREFPGVPQCAVFDTSFYSDLPPRQHVYPLPYAWYTRWGIRRFGFHGISHEYLAGSAARILMRKNLRLVSCHLGNGCSVTASRGGRAVATSMGFTPMEGLMMGTRSGSIDPGILLHVQNRWRISARRLQEILNRESGVKAVSGVSGDFRAVAISAAKGNARARLAREMFADRVRNAIGAMAVTLGGIDALCFAGGIGEHDAQIRARICRGLECLGLRLHSERNRRAVPDARISAAGTAILVLRTDEERRIAEEARRIFR